MEDFFNMNILLLLHFHCQVSALINLMGKKKENNKWKMKTLKKSHSFKFSLNFKYLDFEFFFSLTVNLIKSLKESLFIHVTSE